METIQSLESSDSFKHAKAIVSKLARRGHTAYFAGGWVRDYVMGHPSEDIDIATDATPAQIMDLFSNTILVGLAFGVVIVVVEGHQFEVATFRKDLDYVDGRKPQGIELSNPREDALRRDFTINGMFYDPLEDEIHDFVHGMEDIKKGVIRAIGNPYERFFEDRLRMIRAFRFASRFGFLIENETQEAIRENADKLFPAVALERVWQEFNKMAAYPRFDQALVGMHRLGVLEVVLPEIKELHLNDLKHRTSAYRHYLPHTPTIAYLMALMSELSLEQKLEVARRLRASNRDFKLLEFMDSMNSFISDIQAGKEKEDDSWAHLLSHPDSHICWHVLAAQSSEEERVSLFSLYQRQAHRLEPHIKRLQSNKPLVTASLLKQEGIKPGKLMGALMKQAESIAINHDLHDSVEILKLLKQDPLWPTYD